ncbi:hypothetical protein EJ02DRAFT_360504, partial [Clathrospora elynae]
HTALCLRSDNGATAMIVHITGPNTEYTLGMRVSYEPTSSVSLAREVSVRRLTTPMSKFQLATIIYQTPIDNSSREFNR